MINELKGVKKIKSLFVQTSLKTSADNVWDIYFPKS